MENINRNKKGQMEGQQSSFEGVPSTLCNNFSNSLSHNQMTFSVDLLMTFDKLNGKLQEDKTWCIKAQKTQENKCDGVEIDYKYKN